MKRRREPPSLDGIRIKVERAKLHQQNLESIVTRLQDIYEFVGEVHDEGSTHVYRVVKPPPVSQHIAAIAGDCVHNLRSALDYLVFELIRLTGASPGYSEFPIRRSRCTWNASEQRMEPTPLTTGGALRSGAIEIIEAVQPYIGGYEGNLLAVLKDLDNIDKHRQLWVVATSTQRATSVADEGASQLVNAKWTRRPFAHDQVVAILTYDPPLNKLDPSTETHVLRSVRRGAA